MYNRRQEALKSLNARLKTISNEISVRRSNTRDQPQTCVIAPGMFAVSSSLSPYAQIPTSSTVKYSSSSTPPPPTSPHHPEKPPHLSDDGSGLAGPLVEISTSDDKHGIFSSSSNDIETEIVVQPSFTGQANCIQCKKPNDSPRYKSCSACREKKRSYNEMCQAKKKLEKANRHLREHGDGMGEYERAIAEAVARQAKEKLDTLVSARAANAVPRERASKKKRKSDSFLLDPQAKEKDLPAKKKRKSDVTDLQMRQKEPVMQGMFKKLKEERIRLGAGSEKGGLVQNNIKTSFITNIYTDKRGRTWTEFQNATDMYDYLRSHRLPKILTQGRSENEKTNLKNFRGCYSIIAKPDIDETKRARLVVGEVRKIGKVPFYHKIPTYDCGSKITFRCTCLASSTTTANAPSNASSSGVPLASNNAKYEVCGGKVVVKVEKDMTHPIFPGQKISVEVRHA